MLNYDDYERLQALDDYRWGMAAGEAQKSGYIGTEAAMKLLKI